MYADESHLRRHPKRGCAARVVLDFADEISISTASKKDTKPFRSVERDGVRVERTG